MEAWAHLRPALRHAVRPLIHQWIYLRHCRHRLQHGRQRRLQFTKLQFTKPQLTKLQLQLTAPWEHSGKRRALQRRCFLNQSSRATGRS